MACCSAAAERQLISAGPVRQRIRRRNRKITQGRHVAIYLGLRRASAIRGVPRSPYSPRFSRAREMPVIRWRRLSLSGAGAATGTLLIDSAIARTGVWPCGCACSGILAATGRWRSSIASRAEGYPYLRALSGVRWRGLAPAAAGSEAAKLFRARSRSYPRPLVLFLNRRLADLLYRLHKVSRVPHTLRVSHARARCRSSGGGGCRCRAPAQLRGRC